MEKKKMVILRTEKAGVHMGELVSAVAVNGYYDCELANTRRIWSWAGANSLSNLAAFGSKKPKECNITNPLKKAKIMAIEILYMDDAAIKNIASIPEWNY